MFADALLVTVLGMLVVFIFLLLLVGLMQLIARLCPVAARPAAAVSQPVAKPAATTAAKSNAELIAVLQAAVVAYETDQAAKE